MKNKPLLKKIIEILQQASDHKLSNENLMFFLFGDKLDESDTSVSKSMLYSIINQQRSPSESLLASIVDSTDWGHQRLNYFFAYSLTSAQFENLENNIKNLYGEYFPGSTGTTFNQMIKNLLFLHFFNLKNEPPFVKYSGTSCSNYVNWEQKERTLKSLLKNNRIAYINGLPGTGKKEFVKNFIWSQNLNPYNVAWLYTPPQNSSIKTSFEKSSLFLSTKTLTLKEKLHLLQKKSSDSLLIIEQPYLQHQDFIFIDKLLSTTKIKYIIITRSRLIDGKRAVLTFEHYPVSVLKEIFAKIFPDNFFTKKDFETFCGIINYNPLVTTLIAKTLLSYSKLKETSQLLDLKKMLLDHRTWIWQEHNLPKIHSSYKKPLKKTGVPVTSILHRILNDLPETLPHTALAEMALWCRYQIPIFFLQKILGKNIIESALHYSVLQNYDSDGKYVIMPIFLAETVLNKYPIFFFDYEPKLRMVMEIFSIGQTQTMEFSCIYNAVNNSLYYFQYHAIKLKTRPSKKDFSNFTSWNKFLLDIISYYSNLGNSTLAKNLFEELYVSLNHLNKRSRTLTPVQCVIRETARQNLLCSCGSSHPAILKQLDDLILKYEKIYSQLPRNKDYKQLDLITLSGQISSIYNISLENQLGFIYSHTKSLIDKRLSVSISDTYIVKFLSITGNVCFYLSSEDYNYSMMHYYYLLSLYNHEKPEIYISQGEDYYQRIQNSSILSFDTKLRASFHRFFHILMQSYLRLIYYKRPPLFNDYMNFALDYKQLYQRYNHKIQSNINNQLLFTITNLYLMLLQVPLPYATCPLDIFPVLENTLDSLDDFLNNQSTAQESEKKQALALLDLSKKSLYALKLNFTPHI